MFVCSCSSLFGRAAVPQDLCFLRIHFTPDLRTCFRIPPALFFNPHAYHFYILFILRTHGLTYTHDRWLAAMAALLLMGLSLRFRPRRRALRRALRDVSTVQLQTTAALQNAPAGATLMVDATPAPMESSTRQMAAAGAAAQRTRCRTVSGSTTSTLGPSTVPARAKVPGSLRALAVADGAGPIPAGTALQPARTILSRATVNASRTAQAWRGPTR